MGGGLMQLVAYGAQDIYLTGNPQITFFKVVYRRHTNFSMEAIQQTLNGMNFGDVKEVRQGKYFEIEVDNKDEAKSKEKVEDMCKKLLANLVIEDYKIIESQ